MFVEAICAAFVVPRSNEPYGRLKLLNLAFCDSSLISRATLYYAGLLPAGGVKIRYELSSEETRFGEVPLSGVLVLGLGLESCMLLK